MTCSLRDGKDDFHAGHSFVKPLGDLLDGDVDGYCVPSKNRP
jgi:hypothetical protein